MASSVRVADLIVGQIAIWLKSLLSITVQGQFGNLPVVLSNTATALKGNLGSRSPLGGGLQTCHSSLKKEVFRSSEACTKEDVVAASPFNFRRALCLGLAAQPPLVEVLLKFSIRLGV